MLTNIVESKIKCFWTDAPIVVFAIPRRNNAIKASRMENSSGKSSFQWTQVIL